MEARWETPSLVADGTEITQCVNYRIFLSFRFYVKLNLGECRKVKNAIFAILKALNYDFGTFQPSINAKIHKKSKLRATNCVKMTVFGPQKSQTLISGKI